MKFKVYSSPKRTVDVVKVWEKNRNASCVFPFEAEVLLSAVERAGRQAGRQRVSLELKMHKQRLMHTRLIQNTHCPYSKPLTASPITNHCNPQPASGATLNMQTNYPSSSAFCRRRHLSAAEKLAQPHGRLWSPDVVFVCRASCCSLLNVL